MGSCVSMASAAADTLVSFLGSLNCTPRCNASLSSIICSLITPTNNNRNNQTKIISNQNQIKFIVVFFFFCFVRAKATWHQPERRMKCASYGHEKIHLCGSFSSSQVSEVVTTAWLYLQATEPNVQQFTKPTIKLTIVYISFCLVWQLGNHNTLFTFYLNMSGNTSVYQISKQNIGYSDWGLSLDDVTKNVCSVGSKYEGRTNLR